MPAELGAEVTIVYRRSEKEMPARFEEVHHAREEGVIFRMLTNPTAILGDENGFVRAMTCVEMELGEPDERGRRRPIPKPDSAFDLPVETVIVAIGNSPNPLIKDYLLTRPRRNGVALPPTPPAKPAKHCVCRWRCCHRRRNGYSRHGCGQESRRCHGRG